MQHIYWGIENLNLTNTQRNHLVEALRTIGPKKDLQPANMNHAVIRSDNQAAIFEALVDPEYIRLSSIKQYLGKIFNIDPNTITDSSSLQTFSERVSRVVTIRRGGVNYLRMVIFGYSSGDDWPIWEQSRQEARAYLILNGELWQ